MVTVDAGGWTERPPERYSSSSPPLQGSYLAEMKTYHMKHHYAGLHHVGYGITSKLWDLVFGTELILRGPGAGGSGGEGAKEL